MTYKKIIYTICFCLLFGLNSKDIFATQSVSEILEPTTQSALISDLNQKETERDQSFTNLLELTLPPQTNNPSLVITFTDPSQEKKGIQLEIDNKSFVTIKSPYTIPALSIGEHILKFKFVDNLGTTQLLEKTLILLPRPPIINAPTISKDSIEIYGTGLANSELILVVSSGLNLQTRNILIDGEGKWTLNFNTGELVDGTYSVSAYTRKYGYASDPSESITFLLGEQGGVTLTANMNHFSFKNLDLEKLPTFVSDNPDIIILLAGFFVLGFVISFILSLIFRNNDENKKLDKITKQVTKPLNKEKELTLMERLSSNKVETPSDEKQEVINEEIEESKIEESNNEEERSTFAKMDFLRDFKKFDPDNKKGKEKKLFKKRVKISLTSKRDNS